MWDLDHTVMMSWKEPNEDGEIYLFSHTHILQPLSFFKCLI